MVVLNHVSKVVLSRCSLGASYPQKEKEKLPGNERTYG